MEEYWSRLVLPGLGLSSTQTQNSARSSLAYSPVRRSVFLQISKLACLNLGLYIFALLGYWQHLTRSKVAWRTEFLALPIKNEVSQYFPNILGCERLGHSPRFAALTLEASVPEMSRQEGRNLLTNPSLTSGAPCHLLSLLSLEEPKGWTDIKKHKLRVVLVLSNFAFKSLCFHFPSAPLWDVSLQIPPSSPEGRENLFL